jgi:hypothetical protein
MIMMNVKCIAVVGVTASFLRAASGNVGLQNATATFSQSFNGPWLASEMIDGNFGDLNGWAIFQSGADPTPPQTAVFETTADLTAPGLSIRMFQNYSSLPGHTIGRYRWSYTTDDRGTFADGLQTGGDVSANWTVLTPSNVSGGAAFGSTILGDGSILMSSISAPPSNVQYLVTFNSPVVGATGFRIEAMADSSLPFNGPGMYTPNGNFVITEVQVVAASVFATGNINLSDYIGNYAAHSIQMALLSGTTTIHSATVPLSSSGAYSFGVPSTVPAGTYTLTANGSPFLKRSQTVIHPGGSVPIMAHFVLTNGDCDDSGEVDAADIDLVIAAFGESQGGPGYSLSVDVDGSEEVDAADIDVVIANFGASDE